MCASITLFVGCAALWPPNDYLFMAVRAVQFGVVVFTLGVLRLGLLDNAAAAGKPDRILQLFCSSLLLCYQNGGALPTCCVVFLFTTQRGYKKETGCSPLISGCSVAPVVGFQD